MALPVPVLVKVVHGTKSLGTSTITVPVSPGLAEHFGSREKLKGNAVLLVIGRLCERNLRLIDLIDSEKLLQKSATLSISCLAYKES